MSISSLLEGRSCHSQGEDIDFSRRHRRNERGEDRGNDGTDCPMRGMWAPWLAVGGLERLMNRWLNIAMNSLLLELAVLGLDDRERGIILRDYMMLRADTFGLHSW